MNRNEMVRRWRRVLLTGLAVLGLGAIYCGLALRGIGIPCLFHRVTGWQCPGCGNSRAVLALLRLDLGAALEYNLLFPLEFLYLGWVLFCCCRSYLRGGRFAYQPRRVWMDAGILCLVLIWGVVRNFL